MHMCLATLFRGQAHGLKRLGKLYDPDLFRPDSGGQRPAWDG